MKNILIYIYLCAFALRAIPAIATSVNTPASKATSALRDIINQYLLKGGDLNALSLEKIMPLVDKEAALIVLQGKLEDRFEMLGGSGPIDPSTMTRMIAYTSNQIIEDRRQEAGRYVIWLATDSEVFIAWETERRIKLLLESVQKTLVNKGAWNQPSTKNLSFFHVNNNAVNAPPNDHRIQEDQSGRRFLEPKAKGQNNLPPSGAPTLPVSKTATMPWRTFAVFLVIALSFLWFQFKKRKN